MAMTIDGHIVQIECGGRDYANVILPIFSEFGLHAELRPTDKGDTMQAGGGWEAIQVLVNQAYVVPFVTAAAAAGGIVAGEIVKEAAKDAYKAIKAAIKKCISTAAIQKVSPQERPLGFRIYVLPLTDLYGGPDRLSLDITFESPSVRGKPISIPVGAIEEAFWLFENRLAPLLIQTRALSSPSGQRMDLHLTKNGEVDTSCVSAELRDGRHFTIHGSRDGFYIDDLSVALLEDQISEENPALWAFIKCHLQKS